MRNDSQQVHTCTSTCIAALPATDAAACRVVIQLLLLVDQLYDMPWALAATNAAPCGHSAAAADWRAVPASVQYCYVNGNGALQHQKPNGLLAYRQSHLTNHSMRGFLIEHLR